MAVAVLVLASLISWWFWPRTDVDQRFVGRWDSGNGVFELRDDGRTMYFYAKSNSREFSANGLAAWRVRKGQFQVFGDRFSIWGWLMNQYDRVMQGSDPSIIFEAAVVEVGSDHFVLQERANTFVFERMPN